jgi:DNA-binding transcriptional regulator YiaG
MSEEQNCLSCKNWKRSNDKFVGVCGAFPVIENAQREWRFQYETCGCWNPGEARAAAKALNLAADDTLEGNALREARLISGVSAKELSEMIGVEENTIYIWERKERISSPKHYAALLAFIENAYNLEVVG